MKLLIEKRNYIILLLIIILTIWIFSIKKIKPFIKSFSLNDKVLTIIIYERLDEEKISKNIKSICDKYENKEIHYKRKNELTKINRDVNFSNSYAVSEIIKFFKKAKITKYSINEDGNISVGKRYRDKKYVSGIIKKSDNTLIKTVMLENESMITVGEEDIVTVICKDNIEGYALANFLYNVDIKKAKEISKKYDCSLQYKKENKTFKKNRK